MQTKAEKEINAMVPVEVVPAIEQLNRAEIDMQISTAKQFPRNLGRCLENISTLSCQDQEIAESCIFSKPAGFENGKQKFVEGPSVRFAEILATQWGNLRCEAQIIEIGQTEVTARGVCIDLETNVAVSVPIQKSITYSDKGKKKGQRYSNDMIQTTCNAACSMAYRNAVFKMIPQVYWKSILEKIKKVAVGDEKALAERVDKMCMKFGEFDVDEKMILAKVNKNSVKEIDPSDLSLLIGLYNSITEGDSTVKEIFKPEPKTPNTTESPSMLQHEGGNK